MNRCSHERDDDIPDFSEFLHHCVLKSVLKTSLAHMCFLLPCSPELPLKLSLVFFVVGCFGFFLNERKMRQEICLKLQDKNEISCANTL